MSIGERLRYARERVGLTLTQVQKRVDIGPSSLSDFENEKREPKLSQLHALARVYHLSVSFFLSEGAIPREMVLWRVQPEEAKEIEGRFLKLCNQYRNLEIWCDEPKRESLPKVQGNAQTFEYPQAEILAKQVRDMLQLGDQPGHSLLRVLEEECGVKIFHMEFQPSGTAASTKSEACGSAILLNSLNARWRRNFDLAHELFHLLAWEILHSDIESPSSVAGQREESLADWFAAFLLMPEDAIKDALNQHTREGKVPFEALFDIARLFDVSTEALVWRLHNTFKWRNVEETKKIIEKAKALAPILENEQKDDNPPPKWPQRYHSLAMNALRHGKISIGRFAEYLEISRREALKYVEQEVEDGQDIEITPA